MILNKEIYRVIPLILMNSIVLGKDRVPKIAVIGAGLGGTSVSYFLKELFGDEKIHIDVYEANEIGGRLSTVEIDGQKYETGGSIIHPDNVYMAHYCKKFELQKKEGSEIQIFGLYDGKEVIFSESRCGIWTWIKMLWRYGMNPVKLSNHVEKMLSNFKRIYFLQEQGLAYSSVEELLHAMSPDFVEDVKISCENGFANIGISNRTIDELIMAGLMVNYGQTTLAHKFVGSVSIAAANGHLWAIAGGNKQLPENFLKHSGAKLINGKVNKISLNNDNGQYHVSYSVNFNKTSDMSLQNSTVQNESNEHQTQNYDIVVIAAPLTKDTSQIKFENFTSTSFIPEGRYHRTVCTIVKGDLNLNYFGEGVNVDEIFSIKLGVKINSVGKLQSVSKKHNKKETRMWKVFSQDVLTYDDLNNLFNNLEKVEVVDWLAYPHYDSYQKLGDFVLHENLYHVNAIEWAASAMEMSVIGAKNVALLAHKNWNNFVVTQRLRDEL